MNYCVPDFEMGDDDYTMTTTSSLTKASGEEIMELLWQNNAPIATIIPHNRQSRSRSPKNTPPPPLPPPPQQQPSNHLYMAEDEMASWLHYPLEDFYSEVLYTNNPNHQAAEAPPPPPAVQRPPPQCPVPPATAPARGFPLFFRLRGQNSTEIIRSYSSGLTRVDSSKTPSVGPPSVAASVVVTSSSPTIVAGAGETLNVGDRGGEGGMESPSTASGSATSSATLNAAADTAAKEEEDTARIKVVGDRKREGRGLDESFTTAGATTSELQNDQDAELESADEKKHSGRGSTGTKRSRAAEVHNLSERRRRDRINEKMKALQELIPRCNKTDKASMLDEAIDYLKSLQMQVQMMSMGCGMVPMMYPGMQQQYMPPPMGMGIGMGMGMGVDRGMAPRAVMPFAHPANMAPQMAPRLPLPTFPALLPPPPFSGNQTSNQADSSRGSFVVQSPAMMQHPNMADPYQQYLTFQQMQTQMQMQAAQNQALSQPGSSKQTSSKGEGDDEDDR